MLHTIFCRCSAILAMHFDMCGVVALSDLGWNSEAALPGLTRFFVPHIKPHGLSLMCLM